MKRQLLIVLTVLTLMYGCRPNNNTPVPQGQGYYGRLYSFAGPFGFTNDSAVNAAQFFDQPIDLYSTGTGHMVGVHYVAVNGDTLGEVLSGRNSQGTIMEPYYEGSWVRIRNGINWNVSGANGIPSFTWKDTSPYPQYIGVWPDTVIRSQGVTFDFSNSQIINADSASIQLEGVVTKSIRLPGSISFTPNEIRTANGYARLTFGRYSTNVISGKPFAFVKIMQLDKFIIFK